MRPVIFRDGMELRKIKGKGLGQAQIAHGTRLTLQRIFACPEHIGNGRLLFQPSLYQDGGSTSVRPPPKLRVRSKLAAASPSPLLTIEDHSLMSSSAMLGAGA